MVKMVSFHSLYEVNQAQLPDSRQCLERSLQRPLIGQQFRDRLQRIGVFNIRDAGFQETDEIKV